MTEILNRAQFDPNYVLEELRKNWLVVVSGLVNEEFRQELAAGFKNRAFIEDSKNPGVFFNRREISVTSRDHNDYLALQLSDLVNTHFGASTRSHPRRPFVFNSFTKLWYKQGGELPPHFDAVGFGPIICSVVVDGEGSYDFYPNAEESPITRLAIYQDSDRNTLIANPGDVIFMAHEGFNGQEKRLCHGVRVPESRLAVVYRNIPVIE
jgi:hypothetical protein